MYKELKRAFLLTEITVNDEVLVNECKEKLFKYIIQNLTILVFQFLSTLLIVLYLHSFEMLLGALVLLFCVTSLEMKILNKGMVKIINEFIYKTIDAELNGVNIEFD